MSEWVEVSTRQVVEANSPLLVWLDDDWPVLLIAQDGVIHAVDARCTHQDAWLTQIEADELICPLHDARFDLHSGQATRGPAAAPLTVYPMREDAAGTIWLQLVRPWWRG